MNLMQFVTLSGLLWLKRKAFAVLDVREGGEFFFFLHGYWLEKCVWPQTEMETTDKVAELQNTSSYALHEVHIMK